QHTQTLLVIEESKGFSHILPMLFISVFGGYLLYLFFFSKNNCIHFNSGLEASVVLLFAVATLLFGLFYFIEFSIGREEYRFDKAYGRFQLKRSSLFTSKEVYGLLKNIQTIKILEDDRGEDTIYTILLHDTSHKNPIYLPL